MFRLLRDGPTGRLLVAEAASAFNEAVLYVAVLLVAVDAAGTGAGLTAVLIAAALPRAALLPVGGWLADRAGPGRVSLVLMPLRALGAIGLTVVAFAGAPIWVLAAVVAITGVLDALYFPAAYALLPSVVQGERLGPANAFVSGAEAAGDLAGPALTAGLAALFGAGGAMAAAAGIAVAAALAMRGALRRLPEALDAPRTSVRGGFMEGLRLAWGDRSLRFLLALVALVGLLLAGPVVVGGTLLAERELGGAEALGLLLGGFGLGSLAGLALGARVSRLRLRARSAAVLAATGALGLGIAALGLASSLPVALTLGVAAGLGGGVLNVALMTWLQQQAPAHARGRVMGLVVLAFLALDPVSTAVAGALVPLGPEVVLGVPGLALTLGAALLAVWAATPKVGLVR